MVKKVTLDTLDIEEAAQVFKEDIPAQEGAADKQQPVKRHVIRRRLISAAIIVILIASGGLVYWSKGTSKVRPLPGVDKSIPLAPVTPNETLAVINDFVIPSRDDEGIERAVLCDLTIELRDKQYQGLINNNLLEVRNVIYQAARKRKATLLLQMEGRAMFKEEISGELTKLLGKDIVKRIFFTKFVVL